MLGWFKKKLAKADEPTGPVAQIAEEQSTKQSTIEEDAPLRGTGIFGDPVEQEPEPITETLPEPLPQPQPLIADDTPPDSPAAENGSTSLFSRLTERLSRTRDSLVFQMDSLFLGKKTIDAELLDDLEELLITADIGVETSSELIDYARRKVKRKELSDPNSLKKFIKEKLRSFIVDSTQPAELVMPDSGPFVIMVVGVNGVGKTTTIGKIAHKFKSSGQSVLLAAADTFRAAAVSQLKIWGERNDVEVVSGGEGADPSSVAFDAIARAVEEKYDVIMVDTAGRLHTQTNLMEELKKIKRVIGKKLEGAPHEVLLVIDATTGQNGISQAKLFNEAVEVTGLALTKLDGTAKGGIVANISRYMNIPIRFIGIGEKIEDLRDFDPDEFIEALFQEQS
jgi:fused signal recognition particle receptor